MSATDERLDIGEWPGKWPDYEPAEALPGSCRQVEPDQELAGRAADPPDWDDIAGAAKFLGREIDPAHVAFRRAWRAATDELRKAVLAIERAAGGPVYFANQTPPELLRQSGSLARQLWEHVRTLGRWPIPSDHKLAADWRNAVVADVEAYTASRTALLQNLGAADWTFRINPPVPLRNAEDARDLCKWLIFTIAQPDRVMWARLIVEYLTMHSERFVHGGVTENLAESMTDPASASVALRRLLAAMASPIEAGQANTGQQNAQEAEFVFALNKDRIEIRGFGESDNVPAWVGLRRILRILQSPNRRCDTRSLASIDGNRLDDTDESVLENTTERDWIGAEQIDDQTKREIKQEISRLDQLAASAKARGDGEGALAHSDEADKYRRYLSGATAQFGRTRVDGRNAAKARAAVYNSVSGSLDKLTAHGLKKVSRHFRDKVDITESESRYGHSDDQLPDWRLAGSKK